MQKRIIVRDEWLKACGRSQLSGISLAVIREDHENAHRAVGIGYTVALPNGGEWFVYEWRGVKVVG